MWLRLGLGLRLLRSAGLRWRTAWAGAMCSIKFKLACLLQSHVDIFEEGHEIVLAFEALSPGLDQLEHLVVDLVSDLLIIKQCHKHIHEFLGMHLNMERLPALLHGHVGQDQGK